MTAEPITLKPGTRLRSAVCDTEVIIVRSSSQPTVICCGGTPMLLQGSDPGEGLTFEPGGEGTVMGKRYADPNCGLEVLCTKSGAGALSANGVTMPQKEAKALPASD